MRWLIIYNDEVVSVLEQNSNELDISEINCEFDTIQDDPNYTYYVGDIFDIDSFYDLNRYRFE